MAKWDGRYDNLPTVKKDLHTCSNCGLVYTLRFVEVPTYPYSRLTVDPASMGDHPYNCKPNSDTDEA